MLNTLIRGNCLDIMPAIPAKSIDMILCDLPYGTTACKWDTIIPFPDLWAQYERIIKDNGAIVLTASQPFTSALVMSNPKFFRYEWIWDKVACTGALNSAHRPLKRHESVLVFCKGKARYFPQKTINPKGPEKRFQRANNKIDIWGATIGLEKAYLKKPSENYEPDKLLPTSIQTFKKDHKAVHPTQKPVALFEYLIKTYTLEGETVLDNCAGSGTTGIACLNTCRNYILIEQDENYFNVAAKRLDDYEFIF